MQQYTPGNHNTANSFDNSGGVVSADTFSLSVAGNFDYGTVTTNALNLQVGGDFNYDDSANDFTWRANDSLTVLGNFNIVAAGFENSGNITVTNSLNVTADTFSNSGGVLSADTLALSVAGDFDYSSDYLNNGTITANSLNLTVGGNFSYNDSANDFVLGDNDSLVVSGSANIVAAGFANSGTITVTDSLILPLILLPIAEVCLMQILLLSMWLVILIMELLYLVISTVT